MPRRISMFVLLIGGLTALPHLGIAGDWPQFRGPNGTGIPDAKQFPSEWGDSSHIRWKKSIPGTAWSSPIVVGDKIFVTSAFNEKQGKPRAGGNAGGGGGGGGGGGAGGGMGKGGGRGAPTTPFRFDVYCLDRKTGEVLWKQTAVEEKPRIPTHPSNTYASETPVTDGERIYAYFGMTGLFCFDLGGKLVWKKDLGAYPMQAGWGTSSSPVLVDGRLFVQCDNEEKSFLVALDAKTGDELWRAKREERSTWGTPIVWKNSERTELVAPGTKVRSYNPANGEILWELNLGAGQISSSPTADKDRLYVGCGGGRGRDASTLYAIKAGAKGDVTKTGGVAWSVPKAGPPMASPLAYDGFIYVLERNGGMVSCYDAKSGEVKYTKERIPGAKAFWASPWAHGGKVFCLDEDGQTHVLKAGPEFEVLGTNRIKDVFWATPSAAGDSLLLRGVDMLYCIEP